MKGGGSACPGIVPGCQNREQGTELARYLLFITKVVHDWLHKIMLRCYMNSKRNTSLVESEILAGLQRNYTIERKWGYT